MNPPAPDCVGDVQEYDRSGAPRRTFPAPETPAERHKREDKEREERRKLERSCARREQERALMVTFSSEGEIEAARARALKEKQIVVDRAQQKLKGLDLEKKRLDDEAEFYNKNHPMPDKLKRAFDNNAVLRQQQEHAIADTLQEMERIDDSYDAKFRLYRSVQENGLTPCARPDTP